jgi:hypothetical protein
MLFQESPSIREGSLRNRSLLKRPFWMDEELEIYKSPKGVRSSPRAARGGITESPKTPISLRQRVLEANTPISSRKQLLAEGQTPESNRKRSAAPQTPDGIENVTPRSRTPAKEPRTPRSARKQILQTPSKTPSTPSSVKVTKQDQLLDSSLQRCKMTHYSKIKEKEISS